MFWSNCNNISIIIYRNAGTESYQVLVGNLLKLHRIIVLKKKYRKASNFLPRISQ